MSSLVFVRTAVFFIFPPMLVYLYVIEKRVSTMQKNVSAVLRIMNGLFLLVSGPASASAGTLSQGSRGQGQVTAGAGDLLSYPPAVKRMVTEEEGSTSLAGSWSRGRGVLT